MNFYFISFNSPFYVVRAAALRSAVARTRGHTCKAIFECSRFPTTPIFVCNRFVAGKIFSTVIGFLQSRKLPYVMDIDDAYWDLPTHSTDEAGGSASVISRTDQMARLSSCITTTTDRLAEQLKERFPQTKVMVVPNCAPAELILHGGVCIANTDSFKMDGELLPGLRSALRGLAESGVPVTFLGENDNFFANDEDFIFSVLPRTDYSSYVAQISSGKFQFGFVPVAESNYASCKSDIKILEFLGSGMRVYASAIDPYQRIAQQERPEGLNIVPNDLTNWNAACEAVKHSVPEVIRQQNRTALLLGRTMRQRQLRGWEAVGEELQEKLSDAATQSALLSLQRKLRLLQFAQRFLHEARRLIGFS